MHYELGTFTRGRYGSFLPRVYDPSWFRAQTTDVDRTHMSCQSNLAAIFSPTKNEIWKKDLPWQPIPVHPAPANVFMTTPACDIYFNEFAKVISEDALFKGIDKEFAELYAYMSKYVGTNVTSAMGVYSVYDDLHIEQLLGFQIPSWAEPIYPEPMLTVTGFVFQAWAYTKEMKRLSKCNNFLR